ncbi:MAG: SpoIIE family protein phosphatase [Candidatus Kapabacteria bacterium]|nr:SpoIIE family protein phosphatase [Candidatus Kapabacteria bacterium]
MIKKIFVIFLLLFYTTQSNHEVDSLNNLIIKSKNEIQNVDLLNQIGLILADSSIYEGLKFFEKANKLSKQIKYQKGLALSIYNCANVYYKNDYDSLSILFYETALPYFVMKKDTATFAEIYRKLEYINFSKMNYVKAFEYNYKLLEINTKLKLHSKVISNYISIGNLYLYQNKYYLAQEQYFSALKLSTKYKIDSLISDSYGNLGLINNLSRDFVSAEDYFKKALLIDEKFENKKRLIIGLINYGKNQKDKKEDDLALLSFMRAKAISEETKNTEFLNIILQEIGGIKINQLKYKEALIIFQDALTIDLNSNNIFGQCFNYFHLVKVKMLLKSDKLEIKAILDKGLELASKVNDLELYHYAYGITVDYYKWVGNEKEALKYFEMYSSVKDSLTTNSKSKDLGRLEGKYEAEKESNLKQNEIELLKSNEKQNSIITYASIIGFILASLLTYFAYRSYKVQNTANKLILIQKKSIEDTHKELKIKNEEILSSMRYAGHIQSIVLPWEEKIQQALPNHFILFKPKDIVSGDFYWFAETENEIFFALGDCTGHGISGSMLTMIGTMLLEQAVLQNKISKMEDVFTYVNNQFIKSVNSSKKTRDGMELAILKISKDTNTLNYCGVGINLYLTSNNKFVEYKAQKSSIGEDIELFKTHEISLNKSDRIYLFSDGFGDQNNSEGKKFGKSKLKNLIENTSTFNINEQKIQIENEFNLFKQREPQRDDVTLIGIQI